MQRRGLVVGGATVAAICTVGGVLWLRGTKDRQHSGPSSTLEVPVAEMAGAEATIAAEVNTAAPEVKTAAPEPSAAAPAASPPTATHGEPEGPRARSYSEARGIVDTAIAAGKWTAADRQALRDWREVLSPEQHAELLGRVIVEINRQRLKPEVLGAPF